MASLLYHINADTAFVSAHGFTLKEGLTDFNIYEAELKKQMISHARHCVAISIASFQPAKNLDYISTDEQIPKNPINHFS